MHKLIIPIIIVLIIAAGIGGYFAFQKPFADTNKGGCGDGICGPKEKRICPEDCGLIPSKIKCGDGICDEFEKNNSNVCPKDCVQNNQQEQQQQNQQPTQQPATTTQQPPTSQSKSQEQISQDSPFGIWDTKSGYGLTAPDITSMNDLGVHWEAAPVPPLFPGKWEDWKSHYNTYYKNTGIKPVPMIDLIAKKGGGGLSLSPADYYNSIKSAVSYFSDIDYWMLGVEMDNQYRAKTITSEQYALYIRLTYKALKDTRKNLNLVAAGGGGALRYYQDGDFFDQVFNKLQELENIEKTPSSYNWSKNSYNLTQEDFNVVFASDSYSQYMDGHHFSNFDMQTGPAYYREGTANLVQAIKNLLSAYGYKDIILWDTQIGTYSGQPTISKSPYQSEKDQANDLIRKYIYSLVVGVGKIFWTTTYEFLWKGDPEEYFSNVGLIYNGQGKNDLGFGTKKLAYYTYKKMVEVLDGSDWNNIQTIQEKDGIYVYKFNKSGKNIWVAWNDNSAEKQITISGISSIQVKITEAVPKYDSGKDVTDYLTAFNTETKSVQGGKIIITLKDKPVFAETQ